MISQTEDLSKVLPGGSAEHGVIGGLPLYSSGAMRGADNVSRLRFETLEMGGVADSERGYKNE